MIPSKQAPLALTLFFATVATAATTSAQVEASAETEAPAPPPPAPAFLALQALESSPFRLTGKVRIEKGDEGELGMMMIGGPAPTGTPFEGALEFLRTGEGHFLAISETRSPGIALLSAGTKTLVTTTAPLGAPIDANGLSADLAILTKSSDLMKWAKDSKHWQSAHNAETGLTNHTTTVDAPEPDLDQDDGGAGQMMMGGPDPMAPRVLSTKVELTTDAAGKIRSLTLRVTWSDPQATMMDIASESGEIDFEEFMDAEPLEGATHHYEFQTAEEHNPSPAAKDAMARLHPLTK